MNLPTHRAGALLAGLWLRLLFRLTLHAPGLLPSIKPAVLWLTWRCSGQVRAATTANARWLLGAHSHPHERAALGKRVLARFFDQMVEFGANRRRSKSDMLARLEEVRGLDRFEEVRRLRRGVVLVTAHLGSFETAMTMIAEREPRVHVVFRRDQNRLFERLRSEQHARMGVVEAATDEGLPVWFRLREALRADGVVLIQGDRAVPGERGEVVPFMGGHLRVPTAAVKLARAAGSPLLPTFAVLTEQGRVRVLIGEPIWPDAMGGAHGEPDPAVIAVARAIEACVRQYPDQWLVLHKAWCEDAEPGWGEKDRS